MPDRPAASAAAAVGPAAAGAAAANGPGDGAVVPRDRRQARWAAVGRVLTSKPFRWGFVAVAVALCGYAVVRQWPEVRAGLASLGFVSVAGAMVGVLLALLATMQVWRVLIGALGSPLPVGASARVMFIGQLGKYLPGSVWPVLAQMELGTAHRVPRHRSASASVLTMLLTLLATGGFAFAWCVGFLVVFAPAGAGVRDVVLVAILSPTLGVGNATAVALVSRVLLTVADLITAAVAAGFGRRSGVSAS